MTWLDRIPNIMFAAGWASVTLAVLVYMGINGNRRAEQVCIWWIEVGLVVIAAAILLRFLP